MTQTVPDISPLVPMHQDPLLVIIHMSLYTLKTNDLTNWSTLINSMVCHMYILDVCMNGLKCLVNHKSVILFTCPYTPWKWMISPIDQRSSTLGYMWQGLKLTLISRSNFLLLLSKSWSKSDRHRSYFLSLKADIWLDWVAKLCS